MKLSYVLNFFFIAFLQSVVIQQAIAQKAPVQAEHVLYTDTVDMSLALEKWSRVHLSSNPPLILSYKDSICRYIWLHNDVSDPIIINRYRLWGLGPTQGYGRAFLQPPYIMLPGETVMICQMCFVERAPQNGVAIANLELQELIYKSDTYSNRIVDMSARYTADSLLMLPCFEMKYDTAVFDPVIIDGDSYLPITLKSNRNEPVVVNISTISYDSSAFGDQTAFPVTIPPRSSITVPLRYHPRSDISVVKYQHYAIITFDGIWDSIACTSLSATFVGLAIPPTDDSIATKLFPDQRQILAFVGQMKPTIKTFHFVNNLSDTLRIVSVAMKYGKALRINNVVPSNTTPFNLLPGEKMSVEVEMFDISKGMHYDELIIVVDKAADALHFELQGLQKEKEVSGSVSPTEFSDVDLSIYPNPTSGSTTLTLDGAVSGELEISDVLGNDVYRSTISGMLVWNGARNGTKLPAGTYIARIHSSDASKPFVVSKIFIVQ